MTADDVVFSFNTIINGAYDTTATSPMDHMEKVDDTHVKLVFQLAQVGVTMNIERMESNAWSNDVLRRSDFEFNLIATTLGFPDFDERYALVVTGQPQNFYHIADPELDAAFETNRSSKDPEERIQACHDMIRIMDEHCLILPLFANMRGIAYQEGLEGIEPNPYYSYKIDQWSWGSTGV